MQTPASLAMYAGYRLGLTRETAAVVEPLAESPQTAQPA